MHALFNLFRNVMNYSNLWKIDWKGKITLKIVQARGTHTPTQICAQPYHARSSSHGHLFGIYWGSSAWAGKTRVSKTLYYRGECKAKSTKCQLHATHVGRWIMGWCMCAPCFKFVLYKGHLLCKVPTLYSKFFEILKLVFLLRTCHSA